MAAQLIEHGGHRMLVADTGGPKIGRVQDTYALMEDAIGQGAPVIVMPLECLHQDFLKPPFVMAGDFLQKLANYRFKFAVIGDISQQIARSDRLRDLVAEANRGRSCYFMPDLDALALKLTSSASASSKPAS